MSRPYRRALTRGSTNVKRSRPLRDKALLPAAPADPELEKIKKGVAYIMKEVKRIALSRDGERFISEFVRAMAKYTGRAIFLQSAPNVPPWVDFLEAEGEIKERKQSG